MAKRSAWARQSASQIREIVSAHSGTLLTKTGRVAFDAIHQGIDEVPTATLDLLITSNATFLAKPTMEMMTTVEYGGSEEFRKTHTIEGLKKLLREGTAKLGLDLKRHLANVAARHVLEIEAKDATARLEQRVKDYLRARQIPITTIEDKMDLLNAIRVILG